MDAKSYRLRERAHEELLHDLLIARGINSDTAREQFLNPDYVRDSHNPFLLPDMDKAVERIESAIRTGEKICVWSDYDCDGIPGGVMLTDFLRSIGLTVRHYIPHRHEEGYGLNTQGIDELAREGITLIITIDLGSTEGESIAYAKEKGIDVIVTDHHLVQELPSDAFAVINPKRLDSTYLFDSLCGAGVAWKLVQAMLSKHRPEGFAEGREKWYLDLVAISTLSDMVPLIGENRMLAHFGLKVLRRNRRPGLASLLSLLRIKPATLTEDDIGFMISPRINAASRMDRPETAARLLASLDAGEAGELARELNRVNDERKGAVAATVREINKRLHEIGEGPVIVMGNPKWRPGILGLVANSLAQSHRKPVFLWGREGGDLIRGSVRGDGVVNIVDLMVSAKDIFTSFGGHHSSGGFALSQDKVHELASKLTSAYEELKTTAAQKKEIVLDRQLDIEEIPHARKTLTQLAPFGEGNEKPLFIFPGVSISKARMFGKNTDHLELELTKNSARLSGISFFSTLESFEKRPDVGTRADIVGHIENDWRGQPRIRVIDVI